LPPSVGRSRARVWWRICRKMGDPARIHAPSYSGGDVLSSRWLERMERQTRADGSLSPLRRR
jgi:hypothetical protein